MSKYKPTDTQNPKIKFKIAGEGIFDWWNRLSRINSGDTFLMVIKKLLIRIIGVVVLFAFSPVILIAMIFTFIAVI